MPSLTPVLTIDTLNEFLDVVFPQIKASGDHYSILEIKSGMVRLALDPDDKHIRPGAPSPAHHFLHYVIMPPITSSLRISEKLS